MVPSDPAVLGVLELLLFASSERLVKTENNSSSRSPCLLLSNLLLFIEQVKFALRLTLRFGPVTKLASTPFARVIQILIDRQYAFCCKTCCQGGGMFYS
jgi:hypothetical protein